MICGAGFRHTSLSSLPGVSPPASSASSGETLLAANSTFRLSGTLEVSLFSIVNLAHPTRKVIAPKVEKLLDKFKQTVYSNSTMAYSVRFCLDKTGESHAER